MVQSIRIQKVFRWARLGVFAAVILGFFGCATPDKSPTGEAGTEAPEQAQADRASPPLNLQDGYIETLPPLPESGYILKEIGPGVFFVSIGFHNTLFVVTDKGVILADPLRGAGKLLKQAIASVTQLPVKILVYSHAHLDRIGDAREFAEGARIVAHEAARSLLGRYQDVRRPEPPIAFRRNYTLNFGGRRVELIYPGPGHGAGNILIHLPAEKILMFTDAGGPRIAPGPDFDSVDLYGQVLALQKAMKLDFETWVAGRMHRPGNREEFKELLQYYYESRNANVAALRSVHYQDVARQSQTRDPEMQVSLYHEAVARDCFSRLLPRWKKRLMGFTANGLSHCQAWTRFHLTHKAP